MTTKEYLYLAAKCQQIKTDPAHDFEHVMRVVRGTLKIAAGEPGADIEIIEAAALFHDSVTYKKGTNASKSATAESEIFAESVLNISGFPKEKIPAVLTCITECSFSRGLEPSTLESKILLDADMLDACGALGVMRTFCYAGLMNVPLYMPDDPFCADGARKMRSGMDHFFDRLLLVEGRMHTKTGKKLAHRRSVFLQEFVDELRYELDEIK